MKNPYILCAAIWYENLPLKNENVLRIRGTSPYNIEKGIVFCGWRHGNCLYQMVALTGLTDYEAGRGKQGFLTSDNRFVDRKEAGQIAYASNQISRETDRLFSENAKYHIFNIQIRCFFVQSFFSLGFWIFYNISFVGYWQHTS